ncbi:MAG: DUF72 domain-containing protein [Planctomycetota bacterium]
MGEIRIGTSGFCMPPREYHETFDVVELTAARSLSLTEAQRWRAEAPEDFRFVMRAPPEIAREAFADTPDVRRRWKATVELAAALASPMVVLATPRGFRPTDEHVDRLIRFCQWAHRDRLRLAWEPRSDAWTDDLVRKLCVELSLTHVADPFERRCMRPRPPVYRVHGGGGAADACGEDDFERLRALCTEPLTYCLFSTSTRGDDARAFARHAVG